MSATDHRLTERNNEERERGSGRDREKEERGRWEREVGREWWSGREYMYMYIHV